MLEGLNLKHYVTCPLSPDEVERLEHEAGGPIPSGFRTFLLSVGIPQSLIATIIHDEQSMIAHQKRRESDGFVFAEPGEGLLLETSDGTVLEYVYGEHRIAYDNFRDFLRDNLEDPHDPDQFCWAVQLSFTTHDEQRVRQSLRDRLGLSFDQPWEKVDISPAGVTSYRTTCSSPARDTLKRLEYPAWDSPMLFLDQRLSPPEIRAFKDHLGTWSASNLGFKLINYGILPKDFDAE